MDAVVWTICLTAQECLEDEAQGGFLCCAATSKHGLIQAMMKQKMRYKTLQIIQSHPEPPPPSMSTVQWITGGTLVDHKSVFQAHACRVMSEQDVRKALLQLMNGNLNSKLKKCTHNMYAYQLMELFPSGMVKKFDNDDNGEDRADLRLAQLLEMCREDGVIVVVSRLYGGIKLGPKHFAHITNMARELLISCHDTHWKNNTT